jgi:predicted Rossmann-fold nucleotide-binding protein
MGEMRNALVVRAADALIAVAGEFGTLSEIALALKWGVPVVGLNTWALVKDQREVEAFLSVQGPEEAVEAALRLAAARRSLPRSGR